MYSRQDAAQVQSLVHSPQHAKSSIAADRRQKELFSVEALQQETQCIIQRAIDQSAAGSQALVEGAVTALADANCSVQRQLDKLDRSTVIALSLEELSEVLNHLYTVLRRFSAQR